MQAGSLLMIMHDSIEAMVSAGMITPSGELLAPKDYPLLTTKVLDILKARGVVVPEKAEKIIKLIPLIVDILDD